MEGLRTMDLGAGGVRLDSGTSGNVVTNSYINDGGIYIQYITKYCMRKTHEGLSLALEGVK